MFKALILTFLLSFHFLKLLLIDVRLFLVSVLLHVFFVADDFRFMLMHLFTSESEVTEGVLTLGML